MDNPSYENYTGGESLDTSFTVIHTTDNGPVVLNSTADGPVVIDILPEEVPQPRLLHHIFEKTARLFPQRIAIEVRIILYFFFFFLSFIDI